MNENSKITKSETSTIFSENLSRNSKSAHSNKYDKHYHIKQLTEAQNIIEVIESSADFAFGFIKQILNGEYTREEALNILGEEYEAYLIYKDEIDDWVEEHEDFLEHFEF